MCPYLNSNMFKSSFGLSLDHFFTQREKKNCTFLYENTFNMVDT
jgi:hypothetical protein